MESSGRWAPPHDSLLRFHRLLWFLCSQPSVWKGGPWLKQCRRSLWNQQKLEWKHPAKTIRHFGSFWWNCFLGLSKAWGSRAFRLESSCYFISEYVFAMQIWASLLKDFGWTAKVRRCSQAQLCNLKGQNHEQQNRPIVLECLRSNHFTVTKLNLHILHHDKLLGREVSKKHTLSGSKWQTSYDAMPLACQSNWDRVALRPAPIRQHSLLTGTSLSGKLFPPKICWAAPLHQIESNQTNPAEINILFAARPEPSGDTCCIPPWHRAAASAASNV